MKDTSFCRNSKLFADVESVKKQFAMKFMTSVGIYLAAHL